MLLCGVLPCFFLWELWGWVQQQQQQLEQQQLEQQQQQLEQQKQLEQQQQRRERCLRVVVVDERCEQLQRRFILEQATATVMERARNATGSGGGGSEATTERARPEAPGGGPLRSPVLFGAMLLVALVGSGGWWVACRNTQKNGPLSGV